MGCRRCSEAFENKFVQCFDQQEISMHMKRNGAVKLQYKDIIEMTNFSYCPYCGEKLGLIASRDIQQLQDAADALAFASSPAIANLQSQLVNSLNDSIEENYKSSILGNFDLGDGDSMQGGMR